MKNEDKPILEKFYKEIYSGIDKNFFMEIRTFNKNSIIKKEFLQLSDLSKVPSLLEKYENDNIYFGIASRYNKENGKKESCNYLGALYIDIDVGKDGHKKESLYESIESALSTLYRFPIEPSIIVNSGNGLHVYWLLAEPLDLSKMSVEAESTMKKLEEILAADSTHNIDRIFRIPFSFNNKDSRKECRIIHFNENRYVFENFRNEIEKYPRIRTIQNPLYISGILGVNDFGIDDRSSIDQKIITYLVNNNFNESDIKFIFNIYPTSGKYLERLSNNKPGAEAYLNKSIENAKIHIQGNEHMNYKPLKIFRATDFPLDSYPPNRFSYANNITQKPINENQIEELDNRFFKLERGEEIGYYKKSKNNSSRLTNFLVTITEEVMDSDTTEANNITYLNGKIIFSDESEIKFSSLPISTFTSPVKLMDVIQNISGLKAKFDIKNITEISNAILFFNNNYDKIPMYSFGYNKELTKYYSNKTIITQDEYIPSTHIIREQKSWNNVEPNFSYAEDNNQSVKALFELAKILHEFYNGVGLMGLAASLIPIVYPFLRKEVTSKPYVAFIGPSGCGKTTIIRLLANMFGNFQKLPNISSTHTSISIIGNSLNDIIFPLDDLKVSNLGDEKAIRHFMTLLQNYSDESSRSRANVDLSLKDDKVIKGTLFLSGEDMILNETSTIARGIVIRMITSPMNHSLEVMIKSLNDKIKIIPPFLIKHVLGIGKSKMVEMFNKEKMFLFEQIKGLEISNDNLPRLINNFAIIILCWRLINDLFVEYGFNRQPEFYNFRNDINKYFCEAFNGNYTLIKGNKADEKFKETLWNLIDQKLLELCDLNLEKYSDPNKLIGYYKKHNEQIKLVIKIDRAYKLINEYLKSEGGLGISKDALKTKLIQNGDIQNFKDGPVSFYGEQQRGILWTGKFPKYLLSNKIEKEEENIQSEEKKIEVSIMPAQELLEWPKCIDLDA
ncbi:MAG: hypothetical protein CMF23_11190 [Ignavibacteriae bacterium]|nr:hypothetical protein [Ignavibacteriota bacterium]